MGPKMTLLPFCLDSGVMHASVVLNEHLPFQSKRNILLKKS